MPSSFNRLGLKLALTTITLLLLLAIATAVTVWSGFEQTTGAATQHSVAWLKAQDSEKLRMLAESEARTTEAQLEPAITAGRNAAQYMVEMAHAGGVVPVTSASAENLEQASNGIFFDSTPNRYSDTLIPPHIDLNDPVFKRDLQASAVLDTIFPALLSQNRHAIAVYYIHPQGWMRYHPPSELHKLALADLSKDQSIFTLAAPEQNPDRKTIWTSPYRNRSSQEPIVSAITPIYDNNQFWGVIGIDISISELVEYLSTIKPTANSHAFLLEPDGRFIAASQESLRMFGVDPEVASPHDLFLLEILPNPAHQQIREGEKSQIIELSLGQNNQQREIFLAVTQLQNVGWALGIAAPVSEVIDSAMLSNAIRRGTESSFNSTLLWIVVLFLLTVLGISQVSRYLTRPITTLVEKTQAIAGGDLSTTIPDTFKDELGILAHSFNTITAELAASRQHLDRWSHELETAIHKRTAELAQAKEEAEAARVAAEEASRLKTQFLANMSHELRTPLNSIINFTRIISSGARGPVTEEQGDYLNRVRHSGQHLLGLINDILDLSKIEAGRMELYKERLDLGELVEGMMATAVGLARDKPIELRQEIAPSLPQVEADRTRIRQVLLNLLSNAAKFTERGSITVRVEQQGEEVVLSVADTGIGIAPENRGAIFEEFRQVDADTNRVYQGTGLGLAICRHLIEMHGGRIWVESQLNVGSTFSFSLPAMAVTPETRPAQTLLSVFDMEREGLGVLVIDDDPNVIEIVRSYLEQDGFTVYGLSDSRKALAEARRLQPKAIILDVLMPYRDGWDLLTQHKPDAQLCDIPVILYTIMEEQQLGFYLGANAYLTKPVDEEQLRSTVAQLVVDHTKILIIDDDPDAREIIALQLSQGNRYTVLTASNGREGLERIAVDNPHLIILDLMMPEIDGFAVLEELEHMPNFTGAPVIVLTAKELTKRERDFLNQRVNALLAKGSDTFDELIEKVSNLLLLA